MSDGRQIANEAGASRRPAYEMGPQEINPETSPQSNFMLKGFSYILLLAGALSLAALLGQLTGFWDYGLLKSFWQSFNVLSFYLPSLLYVASQTVLRPQWLHAFSLLSFGIVPLVTLNGIFQVLLATPSNFNLWLSERMSTAASLWSLSVLFAGQALFLLHPAFRNFLLNLGKLAFQSFRESERYPAKSLERLDPANRILPGSGGMPPPQVPSQPAPRQYTAASMQNFPQDPLGENFPGADFSDTSAGQDMAEQAMENMAAGIEMEPPLHTTLEPELGPAESEPGSNRPLDQHLGSGDEVFDFPEFQGFPGFDTTSETDGPSSSRFEEYETSGDNFFADSFVPAEQAEASNETFSGEFNYDFESLEEERTPVQPQPNDATDVSNDGTDACELVADNLGLASEDATSASQSRDDAQGNPFEFPIDPLPEEGGMEPSSEPASATGEPGMRDPGFDVLNTNADIGIRNEELLLAEQLRLDPVKLSFDQANLERPPFFSDDKSLAENMKNMNSEFEAVERQNALNAKEQYSDHLAAQKDAARQEKILLRIQEADGDLVDEDMACEFLQREQSVGDWRSDYSQQIALSDMDANEVSLEVPLEVPLDDNWDESLDEEPQWADSVNAAGERETKFVETGGEDAGAWAGQPELPDSQQAQNQEQNQEQNNDDRDRPEITAEGEAEIEWPESREGGGESCGPGEKNLEEQLQNQLEEQPRNPIEPQIEGQVPDEFEGEFEGEFEDCDQNAEPALVLSDWLAMDPVNPMDPMDPRESITPVVIRGDDGGEEPAKMEPQETGAELEPVEAEEKLSARPENHTEPDRESGGADDHRTALGQSSTETGCAAELEIQDEVVDLDRNALHTEEGLQNDPSFQGFLSNLTYLTKEELQVSENPAELGLEQVEEDIAQILVSDKMEGKPADIAGTSPGNVPDAVVSGPKEFNDLDVLQEGQKASVEDENLESVQVSGRNDQIDMQWHGASAADAGDAGTMAKINENTENEIAAGYGDGQSELAVNAELQELAIDLPLDTSVATRQELEDSEEMGNGPELCDSEASGKLTEDCELDEMPRDELEENTETLDSVAGSMEAQQARWQPQTDWDDMPEEAGHGADERDWEPEFGDEVNMPVESFSVAKAAEQALHEKEEREAQREEEHAQKMLAPPVAKSWHRYGIAMNELLAYDPQAEKRNAQIDEETKEAGEALLQTLRKFKIEAAMTHILKGPSITEFGILPAPGIKLNRVEQLADNLAMELAARSIRIVAPIPGKKAVGVEIPNRRRSTVSFPALMDSEVMDLARREMKLPILLGKEINGEIQIADLRRMPHLLIAGATGSGKSVCVNVIISSLILSRTPQQLRLLMIDPKIVELKQYNDIPHLLTPVITDAQRALQALQWVSSEMERRYALLDAIGAGNKGIESYNRYIKENNMATLPLEFIVVMIDEFADLMGLVGKELEGMIARLAAMSRAVGIHLVLATQRPSVDVVTGLIKANFPTRIAFMVASQTDSRTILDQKGAEQLLGQGDMLFSFPGQPLVRVQGAYLSEEEAEQLSLYIKTLGEPAYLDEIIFEEGEVEETHSLESGGDELFPQALEIALQAGEISTSFLQRKLSIGYNRAARIIDEMEARGIIGPAQGSKKREVLQAY